jgi:hypothetical protein
MIPLHLIMQIVVTLVPLPAAVFVILSMRYPPKDKNWAYATVGLIMGYWLRPRRSLLAWSLGPGLLMRKPPDFTTGATMM